MAKEDSATDERDTVPFNETGTVLKESAGDSSENKLAVNKKGTGEPKGEENVGESQKTEGDEAGDQDETLEKGKHFDQVDAAGAVKDMTTVSESAEKERVLEADNEVGTEKKDGKIIKCETGVESHKPSENEINSESKSDDAKEAVVKEAAKDEEMTDDVKDQDTSDAVKDGEMADEVKDQEAADEDEEMADEDKGQEVAGEDEDEKMTGDEKDSETADEVKDKDGADDVKDKTKKRKRGKSQYARKKGAVKEKDKTEGEGEGEARKRKRGEGKRKPKEPITPAPRTIDRPVRERKSVERLVASVEKQRTKGFVIGKGQGTVLNEIPIVCEKLARKKNVETVKALHLILYGRRAKITQCRSNVLQFSGFVWHENEEKQRSKIKDKLDKLNKDKLCDICDVLDVSGSKTARKEDIIARLLDFMAAPHAASETALADKEQSNSSRKRKRKSDAGGQNKSEEKPGSSSSKKMMKSVKPSKAKSTTDDESEEDEENEVDENGNASAEDELPNKSESDKEAEDSDGDENEDSESSEPSPKKSNSKVKSSAKGKTKKSVTPKRETSTPQKTSSRKASTKKMKVEISNEKNSKRTQKRKKDEEVSPKKPKRTPKSSQKEKSGTKGGRATNKSKKDDPKPSEEELRQAICDILKEVDFNTATFTDILKKLASHFKVDLMPRKTEIKGIIQEELTKLAEADTEEESESDKDITEAASNKDENSE